MGSSGRTNTAPLILPARSAIVRNHETGAGSGQTSQSCAQPPSALAAERNPFPFARLHHVQAMLFCTAASCGLLPRVALIVTQDQ